MIKNFLTLGLLLSLLLCAACATQPEPAGELELVAELDQAPGNIAVTPDGRLILSQHPIFRTAWPSAPTSMCTWCRTSCTCRCPSTAVRT